MSLVVGTVTVNPDMTFSGTGMAIAIANARRAVYVSVIADSYDAMGAPFPDITTGYYVTVFRMVALDSVAIASAVVGELVANAVVSVPGVEAGATTATGSIG